jgi:hypothetical protein
MPTFVDLTFGSTTFATSDVRLSLSLYDGYLDLRLEALGAGQQTTTPDYFLLDFALSPDGKALSSLPGGNSPLFIYSLDYLPNHDSPLFFTNDVTLSCLPGECAAIHRSPPYLSHPLGR